MSTAFVLVLLISLKYVCSNKMDGFVVGGAYAIITEHPHAAYIAISCIQKSDGSTRYWLCGGSIVNQVTILTAAHCINTCSQRSKITVRVGEVDRKKGIEYTTKRFTYHKKFDEYAVENDIGVILLKNNIKFGPKVKRIVLMKKPPKFTEAQIAGWGRVDEGGTTTNILKTARQKVLPVRKCKHMLHDLPDNTFCAGDLKDKNYVAQGDSGSALVINGFIQVGIVSYRDPYKYKGIAVYTQVEKFIDWIADVTKNLYCS